MRHKTKHAARTKSRRRSRSTKRGHGQSNTCTTKYLRDYQARDVCFVIGTDCACCIEGSTGSGKTLTATTVAAILLRNGGATGVLITTPMEHIEDGFTNRDYDQIQMPAESGSAAATHSVPHSFIQAARDNGGGDYIHDYLLVNRDHACACTHIGLILAKLPRDLRGKVLLVDEAHRAPIKGNKFSRVIDQWEKRGGRVVFFTATPFRGDGARVVRPNMLVMRRPLAQHMTELDADGHTYAPKKLEVSIVPLIEKSSTAERFQGDCAPPATTAPHVARAMVKMWIADGRPPLMIRIPPNGGSDQFVRRLLLEFRKTVGDPSRVVDASGVGEKHKRLLIELLRKERKLPYERRTVDVIIGIQRMLEGTDWPHCAAMYVYGLPKSPTAIVQLIGRTTRKKGRTHPFADTATTRFFVETLDDDTCNMLQRTQAVNALGIACLLGDIQSPAEWTIEKMLVDNIKETAVDTEHAVAMLAELSTDKEHDLKIRMEVQYALAALLEKDKGMTVREAIHAVTGIVKAHNKDGTTSEHVLAFVQQIAAEHLVHTETTSERAARLAQEVARRSLVDRLPLSAARRRIYEAVIDEFNDETMTLGANITQAAHHAHAMLGTTMQKFATRIFGRSLLTEAEIRAWGDTFHEKYNRYPQIASDNDGLPDGEDWAVIDTALRYGRRGLKGGSSLAKMFGYDRPDHNITLILQWADKCHRLTGHWPTCETGTHRNPTKYGLPDRKTRGFAEDWHAIDMALRYGLRGLPGRMSLYRLLVKSGRIRPRKHK